MNSNFLAEVLSTQSEIRILNAGKMIKKPGKRNLIQCTTDKLRSLLLQSEPGALIGSLGDVSELLGVGIVTVQQVARVLEHEGLLVVRRGPRGGYYATRPDESLFERTMATYMRIHSFGYREVFELTTLLDCEIFPAIAQIACGDTRAGIQALLHRIDSCETRTQRATLEADLRNLLLHWASNPVMDLLQRIAMHFFRPGIHPPIFSKKSDIQVWKDGRRRMLDAVLKKDVHLAKFEAERFREQVIIRLHN